MSKQKEFHTHKSYKTRISTLFFIGNFGKNIDLFIVTFTEGHISMCSCSWQGWWAASPSAAWGPTPSLPTPTHFKFCF